MPFRRVALPRAAGTRRRRRVVQATAGVVALAAAAGGATAWASSRSDARPAAATSQLVTVSTSTVRQTVSATGTLRPARAADLSFTVPGTVTSVSAAVGKVVTKGQVLARVGTDALETAVEAAQAERTAAQEQLDAQEDADASDVQVASAKAQLAQAASSLASAKADLAAGALTSPIAGTVASVDLAVGDTVSGSGVAGAGDGGAGGVTTSGDGSTSSSSAQVVVISTDSWLVEAAVGSADLASVKKGLQVEITPTGSSTKAFGVVGSVGIVASSSTSGSATFPVVVRVTGKPKGLYAGGTVTAAIIVKQLSDVLTVPTLALTTTDGKTVVHRVVGGSDKTVPVTVGESFGATTQVLSGLSNGDQVRVTFQRPGGTGSGGTRGGGGQGGFPGGGQGGFPGGGQGGLPGGGQGGLPGDGLQRSGGTR